MTERKEELNHQIELLKSIRSELGMNRTQFSEYMEIPLRTLEEWEAGRRKMPSYVLRLILYYTKIEKLMRDKEKLTREDIYGKK